MRIAILLAGLIAMSVSCGQRSEYLYFEGPVFGTGFHITYESPKGRKYEKEIMTLLMEVNGSLSTYDSLSVISRINGNDAGVKADHHFTKVYLKGKEVSDRSDGAFDMTVAPLVNAWGFGFKRKEQISTRLIDSLLAFTGYQKVKFAEERIVKEDPRMMLDASAIAKGYGVDVVAEWLESWGVKNYLVEIGGEHRCKGINSRGTLWRVGVDKPLENILEREIQEVFEISGLSLATSGNYRQFYVEDGVKYSHTIDPKTGYPARSNLLSATVLAGDCMTADAWATAFMVLGLDRSVEIYPTIDGIEVFFIFSDSTGKLQEYSSPGLGKLRDPDY